MSRSTRYTLLVLALVLIALGSITVYVAWFQHSPEPTAAERSLLERDDAAAYTTLSGDAISFDELLADDQYVLVTSWASWCPFCGQQLRDLETLASTYSESVTVVAVNRKESAVQAERFLRTLPTFSHIEIILDPDDRFYRDIEGYTIPESVLYAPDGSLVVHIHGMLDRPQLNEWASTYGW